MLISGLCVYSIKSGKVVILLAGRYAGRKAIVVKASDDGNDAKKFGHALGKLYLIPFGYFQRSNGDMCGQLPVLTDTL
ncbi:hypothetical protein EON65_50360 [archaeon]|nr:MAG: hypothetical protein EON65_50360 [archaeon]